MSCFFLFLNLMEEFLLKIILFINKFLNHSKLNSRIEFELKNSKDFSLSLPLAKECFFVSSEGELEIVWPIIETFLAKNKPVKILFTSPSVELKILNLKKKYPLLLCYLRLPLLTRSFALQIDLKSWLEKCESIYFVRYEFYPFVFYYALVNGLSLKLISAKTPNSIYKKLCFLSFDKIIFSLDADLKKYQNKSNENKVKAFDFRIPQIYKRVNHNDLEKTSVLLNQNLLKIYSLINYEKGIIFGSAYLEDLKFIKDVAKAPFQVAIFPHNLDSNNINKFQEELKSFNLILIDTDFLNSQTLDLKSIKNGHVFLFNLKGVLCESYKYFKHAYVGGGIQASIHSLLEPYISNNYIYCGPNIHKSTEYEYIQSTEPTSLKVISLSNNLKDCLINDNHRKFDNTILDEFESNKNWIIS